MSRSRLNVIIMLNCVKNLKHMGYFTHIILICVRFNVMRDISFRGRVSVGRNARVSREMRETLYVCNFLLSIHRDQNKFRTM